MRIYNRKLRAHSATIDTQRDILVYKICSLCRNRCTQFGQTIRVDENGSIQIDNRSNRQFYEMELFQEHRPIISQISGLCANRINQGCSARRVLLVHQQPKIELCQSCSFPLVVSFKLSSKLSKLNKYKWQRNAKQSLCAASIP